MSLLGIDPSEEHQAVLRSLGNGECIFRDLDGRAGRIVIDLISEELRRWLKVFIERFFANQFKRSCMPDGPKVGTVSLSPRGDWRMPSDATVAAWLRDLEGPAGADPARSAVKGKTAIPQP